jgi:hypothetical protein
MQPNLSAAGPRIGTRPALQYVVAVVGAGGIGIDEIAVNFFGNIQIGNGLPALELDLETSLGRIISDGGNKPRIDQGLFHIARSDHR